MQWEQRKPLWPIVAALGLLLVLAIAAPHSWQNLPLQQAPSVALPQLDFSIPSVVQPAPAETEPILLQPSVTIHIEPLPVCKPIDLDTLLSVRDSLLAILDQMPAPQPIEFSFRPTPEVRAPHIRAPQVQVSSASDRLAMVPRRKSRPKLDRKQVWRKPAPPVVPSKRAREEAAAFAAILLEASRAGGTKPVARPRLAMRSTTSGKMKIAAAAKTQAVESETIAPPVVVAPLVQPAVLRHRPLALIEQLEDFSASSAGAVWSQHVLRRVRHLTEDRSGEVPEVTETLDQLEQLYVAGIRQSKEQTSPSYNIQWQQAAQALGRRLVLWRLMLDPQQTLDTQASDLGDSSATAALLPALTKVAEVLDNEKNGDAWRDYLLLDRIVESTSESLETPALSRAKLAQKVLARMEHPKLTKLQRDLLEAQPFVQLQQALRPWAAGTVNLETLSAIVERYESGRENRYAAVMAQLQQRLQWSEDPQLRALAAHLDEHYRGANMRIAMSDHLLNRMMPKQKPTISSVNEQVAGAKVRGRARTTTQLRVRLMPDPDAWHFALEANGKVYSDTRSDTWPARIRNAAKMQYQGRKEISIDAEGLHVTPAKATAQGRNELIGVDSQLDPIPVVGYMLRNMARKKHKKSRPTAIKQAKSKVVRQVKQRMDATLNQKLEGFEEKFRDKVLAPIEELALLAEPLNMHTTKQRAVMQLRFANPDQLAAHTLRPIAPSDSVLSLQMHETALNNAMMGLGLNGRRMTMLELFETISERFGQPDATPPEDLPRRAVIQFASRDALRVQCDGDRLELVLSVAELAHRRDRIKNFQIHVHFRPVLSGLGVKLARDGSLQFSGRRLKTGPRIVLHSIMGKLLVKNQEITVVNAKLMLDPRFAGLMITQLVIEDGWIGLALGPASSRRTAWRSSTPEVLETPFVR